MKIPALHIILILILAKLLGTLGTFYRGYINIYNINDFGVADSHTNAIAVLCVSLFVLSIINANIKIKGFERYKIEVLSIISVIILTVVYEFLQVLLSKVSVFDWKDIMASLITGIIVIVIHRIFYLSFWIYKK